MLAERMLKHLPDIDVRGMAVGNGCWGNKVGLCSDSGDSMTISSTFFHGHTMFDDVLWEEMQEHCDWYNVTAACRCVAMLTPLDGTSLDRVLCLLL